MSTLIKEWLQQTIAELEEERDAMPGVVNEDAAMALAAMKLALESLESEPVSFDDLRDAVAEVSGAPAMEWSDIYKGHQPVPFINFNSLARIVDKFRTAPPAPVSVPDEIRLLQSEVTIWKDRWELLRELFREIADKLGCDVKDHEAMLDKIEMLQGAEHVTTANKLPFEQWLSQQTGTIDVECGCVMTEVFFHWLRVAYEAGNYPVIPDGWVACSERMPEKFVEVLVCTEDGSRYVAALNQSMNWDDGDFFDDIQYVTHWMPLPAAPQQEVK